MLELVFVIVVAGILAAALIPRMDRDTLYEASEQLLRDIKYTQHMAMMDNVYQDDVEHWFYERWKIQITDEGAYTISKGDSDGNLADTDVTAQDPLTRNAINGTEDYNLEDKYGVAYDDGDAGTLYFDHMGRPYWTTGTTNPTRATSNLLTADLEFELTEGGDTATITIRPETGYADVTYN